jgi:hypothetical protein
MKPFTKKELFRVFLIFAVVFAVTGVNLRASLRRARDAQRKGDLGQISNVLGKFFNDYGFFPPSEDGKIKMCKGDNFDSVIQEVKEKKPFDRELFFSGLRSCEWGKDGIEDILDPISPPYIKVLPSDPKQDEGISYYYLSNAARFQVYAYLEGGKDETGYDAGIVARNLPCGIKICSFGKSYGVPVDKSIEYYEKELLESTGK